jgi:hypothetical protein
MFLTPLGLELGQFGRPALSQSLYRLSYRTFFKGTAEKLSADGQKRVTVLTHIVREIKYVIQQKPWGGGFFFSRGHKFAYLTDNLLIYEVNCACLHTRGYSTVILRIDGT